ncbi:cell wall metabolism sensor histidine kinase WalK [Lysinibacillus sp. BW-2-10]|uniref:sensor histidine kinase n=1 Tax=Lysinibacillus sp. BW-2-10 TaxID=2590030 RepID=UPI00117F69EC|nr:HAMP domain-containing sensor histidine kinase [Lysinibacillus sp. BW-2-10]TSI04744.1 HAMP domain-containing histidine kinase [Lysinibacillus sp. BW-2-10]
MFNQTRKKLSSFYAICFFLFFVGFIIILYFALVQLMENQQLEELETYYTEEQHDFFEHLDEQDKKIKYAPNRTYFYYVYTQDHKFVHGDETVKGFYQEIEKIFQSEDISQPLIKRTEWKNNHFLLLSKPIIGEQDSGYIILGKMVTSQHHFFQKMIWLFIILTCVFTILLGLVSYFMAGKAMIPIQQSFEKQKKFVSDASHELRTPLSIFYSSLDILEADEIDNLSSFGKELVSDLKEEAELMKDLLEKMLFLARHDQNRLEIKKESILLSEMLENISGKFERTLPKTITFHSEIEKNVQLMGDSKSINELIYILLENASQYTQQGSIIIKLATTDTAIKVFIEDTGIGISKEDLPLIFDRFYRSDLARKRDGTGLGLSIAKAIVEEHGGTIQVQSELGKGTSFCIEFSFSKNKEAV